MNSSTIPKIDRYWCALIWLRMRCSYGFSDVERGGAGQALGHEIAREIQILVVRAGRRRAAMRAQRGRQRRLVIEVVVHGLAPFRLDVKNSRQNRGRNRRHARENANIIAIRLRSQVVI